MGMDLLHHGMALAAFDMGIQEKENIAKLDGSHSTTYFI